MFHLSGGEKQRIACASVAIHDPPVIILDEPSANLDQEATAQLSEMIVRWKAQGKTIIISEHRLHYLKMLADRFVLMEEGTIKHIFHNKRCSICQMRHFISLAFEQFILKN